ncbi:MAG: hypothetical protein R3331_05250 [Sulfurospirillaceae bacterium]|nr:hypothetical protein [Sulfurospirillaceae bacterium]
MEKKYIQEKNLPLVFDLSVDFFRKRKEIDFFKGIHYFPAPSSSATKKAVIWNIEATENWFIGNEVEPEVLELLNRK